jgi:hypothetical protein
MNSVPGPSPWRTLHLMHTIEAVLKFSHRRGLLGPFPSRRRACRVILQFLAGGEVSRRRIGVTGQQDEARLSVTEMRPDDHERPGAQIANSLRK